MIKDGNNAVHRGDTITDRALISLKMPQYEAEFQRRYGYTAEEARRFADTAVISTSNKRATLHTTKQWTGRLERDFHIVMDFMIAAPTTISGTNSCVPTRPQKPLHGLISNG